MRFLNESVARQANLEDGCKGRFWEGRFKSSALLDVGAVLSAMVYNDLNPFSASVDADPEQSEFVSLSEPGRSSDPQNGVFNTRAEWGQIVVDHRR